MKRRQNQGILLMTAIVIAFIMALWAVAALYRNSFMSSGVLYSYQKSESFYLAKRAVSRSLFYLNGDGSWVSRHNSRTAADRSTEGALAWVEAADGGLILKCEAQVGKQTSILRVPLKSLDRNDTHLYSITPSADGGPDLIAWKTAEGEAWSALPMIPGSTAIKATVGSGSGDVFVVALGVDGREAVWRYRAGRGWVKLPELPAGTELRTLSVGDSTRLVGLSSSNSLQVLNLESGQSWTQISAPSGVILTDSNLSFSDPNQVYAAGMSGSSASVHRYDFESGQWSEYPAISKANFNASGELISESGSVPNLEGGVAAGPDGNVYVASNPPGEPSVIYEFEVAEGDWRAFPLVPNYHWDGSSIGVDHYASSLKDLSVDDDGMLWVQWQSPDSADYSTILVDTSGI